MSDHPSNSDPFAQGPIRGFVGGHRFIDMPGESRLALSGGSGSSDGLMIVVVFGGLIYFSASLAAVLSSGSVQQKGGAVTLMVLAIAGLGYAAVRLLWSSASRPASPPPVPPRGLGDLVIDYSRGTLVIPSDRQGRFRCVEVPLSSIGDLSISSFTFVAGHTYLREGHWSRSWNETRFYPMIQVRNSAGVFIPAELGRGYTQRAAEEIANWIAARIAWARSRTRETTRAAETSSAAQVPDWLKD